MEKLIYKVIRLAELDLTDRRFRFTMGRPDRPFLRAVEEVGLLQPVVITRRQERAVLVDGWKRVEAARTCGLEELPALEMAEKVDDLAVFWLAFLVNYSLRPFSLAEKSLAVRRLYELGLKQADLIDRVLPLLELPPEGRTLKLMLEVSALEEKSLEIIHRRDWKPVTAELWLNFKPAERAWLLRLVEKLTHNQQREVIENFYTLKRRTGKSPEELVSKAGLAEPVNRLLKGEAAAAGELLAALRVANAPLLSRLHQSIGQEIRNLGLPENVSLDYDPNLESAVLRLRVEAGGVRELKEALESLSESLDRRHWEQLFELLHYEGE